MSPDTLRTIGEALYGADWRIPLARAIGVDRRTIHRWATGEIAPPETLSGKLKPLLTARRKALREYERML